MFCVTFQINGIPIKSEALVSYNVDIWRQMIDTNRTRSGYNAKRREKVFDACMESMCLVLRSIDAINIFHSDNNILLATNEMVEI